MGRNFLWALVMGLCWILVGSVLWAPTLCMVYGLRDQGSILRARGLDCTTLDSRTQSIRSQSPGMAGKEEGSLKHTPATRILDTNTSLLGGPYRTWYLLTTALMTPTYNWGDLHKATRLGETRGGDSGPVIQSPTPCFGGFLEDHQHSGLRNRNPKTKGFGHSW